MRKLNRANVRKTIDYLKRCGLRDTYLAALERLQKKEEPYFYAEISDEEACRQQENSREGEIFFSIVVPLFKTDKAHLRAMISSVLSQTYPHFELILADASPKDSLEEAVKAFRDERICYLRLDANRGIAENTNAALQFAKGEYIGLLDHDDLLTRDALYENARAIREAKESGKTLRFLYSDEDKCDGEGKVFYEPNFKPDFNLDLFLSNNYICHFAVLKGDLIKEIKFRKDYDGAQDYDLFLRAFLQIKEEEIAHIPKVLYHWRCHENSTAQNPKSKRYAYEAGRAAIEDFCKNKGWDVRVHHTNHLGFYRVEYVPDVLSVRQDILAAGGPLYRKKKIAGGMMNAHGKCLYFGLKKGFSGSMHRAVLSQDAYAVDVRNILLRPKEEALLLEMKKAFFLKREENEKNYRKLSLLFCRKLKESGGRILYLPDLEKNP